jgi:uncharacterized protein (TIGR03437 family)
MLFRSLVLCAFSGLAFAASYPVLTYSTYLRDGFTPAAIVTDPSGNIYIAGNAVIDPSTAQSSVLLIKLNPQGTQYLYTRFLGGSVYDQANAIAVDSTGNAYVAGYTISPDFPVTSGGSMATPAPGQRSFVAKFDPDGVLLFSDLLGGTAASVAQGVAVNSSGQIVVTGLVGSGSQTFPTTPGAYSIANPANAPYLLELDPTGTKLIFSATGIGGSAIALDALSNIYVAGTTHSLTYPTTPGAYQSTFPAFMTCIAPCTGQFQGANQYVTKVDPTGSKLIYSTAVSGSGNTSNGGLAVDAAGNAYLTGYAGATYPYTVTPPTIVPGPALAIWSLPFLSKLDPTGHTLLFSVPVGGTGVQVDTKGAVYVGGGIGGNPNTSGYAVMTPLPALANIPAQCLPNSVLIDLSAYVAQVDASSGNVLGSQFIGGSQLVPSGVALSGSTLWIAGQTTLADFAETANTITVQGLGTAPLPGAYLGAVDFSQPQPPAGTPQIACILDSANLAASGPAAPYKLLTIFGTGLGPATPVTATNNTTTSLGGTGVTVGPLAAPLLYAFSTQINFAVPGVTYFGPLSLQLTVNGLNAAPQQIPMTASSPSLFLNPALLSQANETGFIVTALNADGSLNSAANPAQPGSTLSVFINGLDTQNLESPLQFSAAYGWSVTGTAQLSPFVLRVNLQVPSAGTYFNCPSGSSVCTTGFTLYQINPVFFSESSSSTAPPLQGAVFVNP